MVGLRERGRSRRRAAGERRRPPERGLPGDHVAEALPRLQAAYREYGLELAVIEDTAPMDAVRLGTAGHDEQISWLHDQIRAMGGPGGRAGQHQHRRPGARHRAERVQRDHRHYGRPPARYGRQVGEDALR